MRRKKLAKNTSSDNSDDEPLSRKASKIKATKKKKSSNDDSSSDSDIENYLQPADKIDLNSPFFNIQNDKPSTSGSKTNGKLSDSDFDSNNEETFTEIPVSNFQFQDLQEYSKKMEEMKRCAEEYKIKKQTENKQMNITNLLAAGEAKQTKEEILAEFDVSLHSSDYETCSESEKEGWEEVKEKQKEEKEENVVPKEGLQITVEMPGPIKKKKGVDLMASIKRRINRIKKENQVLIHKVHLLCWIAHGNKVSSTISSLNLLSIALSLMPLEYCVPVKNLDLNFLEKVLKWYRNYVTMKEVAIPNDKTLQQLIETQIKKKEVYNKNMLVYIFVLMLRSMGIQCRLVLSFQVEPLRPPDSELISLSTKTEKAKAGPSKTETVSEENGDGKNELTVQDNKKTRSKSASETLEVAVEENKKTRSKSTSTIKNTDSKKTKPKKENEDSKLAVEVKKTRSRNIAESNNNKTEQNKKARSSSVADTIKSQTKTNKNVTKPPPVNTRTLRSRKIPQVDGANDSSDEEMVPQVDKSKPITNGRAKRQSKRIKFKLPKYQRDSEEEFETRSPFSNKNSPRVNGILNKTKESLSNNESEKPRKKPRTSENSKKQVKEQKQSSKKRRSGGGSDADSDYVPEEDVPKKKRRESEDDFTPKTKTTRRVQSKMKKSNENSPKNKQGTDIWVEVFVESEKRWISVDVVKSQVNCVKELHTRATQPVCYVIAWDNRSQLKDVTGRYCQNFNTVTRKLRVDPQWWEETLKPFAVPKTPRDKKEDEELEKQQLEKPLPTTISEYKNHPLYVLKRHLLKFEAIYPPDPPTLGFVRNEPVYPRQCVYTLHSRDIWLKKAKVVKLGEKPYKIVKARPKYDKLSNTIITDQLLEVFGPWQTEDYVPPTAENGVVPRNAFGNVDLFQPSMLPKKCVHLKLPGLNKLARRMNIDCAPAIVGFDFHGGWSHPTYDGYVVCEEYAEILQAAWELEQDELDKREQEKIDKRVYGNWKRLIKGLLIRERLKAKYEFGEVSEEKDKKKAKGAPKLAIKKKKVVVKKKKSAQTDSDSE